MDTIPGSRCPKCLRVVAPPARFCPDHPVGMEPVDLQGYGEVISFTTLYSPPEGFSSPLHIALVELPGGARFFCHGAETRRLRVGRRVSVEAVDQVFYFAHLGLAERARLFWRRAGDRRERVTAIVKSVVKRLFSGGNSEGSSAT
ncbi:MAG: OB-fold domain-containing protein [Candidatus Rokubacteria bacterium]|nr:OB-fold domain-containing protein [Candidatus Rokubacteria bacterium]